MFKLGKFEDVEIEEDFLQEVFAKKNQQIHVTKAAHSTPTILQKPNHSSSSDPQVNKNSKRELCSNNENQSLKRKSTSPVISEHAITDDVESDLDEFGDVDWDQCFAENDLNEKQTLVEKPLNKVANDRLSFSGKEKVNNPNNTCLPVPESLAINDKCNLHTPTSSTNKQLCLRSKTSNGRQRKFPGPAGLLPAQKNGSPLSLHFPMDTLTSDDSNEATRLKDISNSMVLSQVSENPFESSPWLQMQDDLDLNSCDSHILKKYNIDWVLKKATSKQLPDGKVPFLILVLKSILEKNTEASVVFKDETGEIPGTIHRKVFEEFEDCLLPGSVLVVRKVSVFSPNSCKHYLIVNPSTLVCLYSTNISKPKNVVEGVTNLKLQVREYALEPYMAPDTSRRTPPLSNRRENCQPSHSRFGLEKFKYVSEQSTVKPVLSETIRTSTVTNQINSEFEELIQDDELNKFLEELDNDSD